MTAISERKQEQNQINCAKLQVSESEGAFTHSTQTSHSKKQTNKHKKNPAHLTQKLTCFLNCSLSFLATSLEVSAAAVVVVFCLLSSSGSGSCSGTSKSMSSGKVLSQLGGSHWVTLLTTGQHWAMQNPTVPHLALSTPLLVEHFPHNARHHPNVQTRNHLSGMSLLSSAATSDKEMLTADFSLQI